jgi:hypothetical protein
LLALYAGHRRILFHDVGHLVARLFGDRHDLRPNRIVLIVLAIAEQDICVEWFLIVDGLLELRH